MQVLNFAYFTKDYIYLQLLFNTNELDVNVCLVQVKMASEIEYICKNANTEKDFHIEKYVLLNLK